MHFGRLHGLEFFACFPFPFLSWDLKKNIGGYFFFVVYKHILIIRAFYMLIEIELEIKLEVKL